MRVSFDSNVWEKVFYSDAKECVEVRNALADQRIEGFICEAAFRIEAVRKIDRIGYFAHPKMDVTFPLSTVHMKGKAHVHFMSIGPSDKQHPGLPSVQADRLQLATSNGFLVMRGLAWMGLPWPREISDSAIFVQETENSRAEREQLQVAVNVEIWKRGVGKQAFDAAGGWQAIEQGMLHQKKFSKAYAEWADGELAAAHVGYRNDILCTDDRAGGTPISVFNELNRSWLTTEYGVRFVKLKQLAEVLDT
ncbi:hypothetical protein [Methylocystis sp. SB2]|uniref:hypothetical protein n=1 Tax=Methylocystis sp. (strain SB2) TaxID=743836 RepID=UPI0004A22B36|nr:hypothetical protein [Methylocystis sp. SB2]ULO24033.1 hypothetical protein LNB28_01050 [Methylocystis sp. SB2]